MATITLRLSSLPSFDSLVSRGTSHLICLSSKMKSKNIISKNMLPNAAITACAPCKCTEYCSGWCKAKSRVLLKLNLAATDTIMIGSKNRIKKTAMIMPTVINIFCQNSLMRCKILALIMAFSKLKEISMPAKIKTVNKLAAPRLRPTIKAIMRLTTTAKP